MQVSTGEIKQFDDIFDSDDLNRVLQMTREEQLAHMRDNGGWVPLEEEEVKPAKKMSKPRRKNWMRNKPCICGSGEKFKKCCWGKYK